MLTLYDNLDSGNAYKVRWILAQRGLKFKRIETSVDDGSTQTAEFLALNPNGKIPTLVLEDGTVLTESNAILLHFADGTSFWPSERLDQTRVLQWMFFEQYTHESSIAVSRFIRTHLADDHPRRAELEALQVKGHKALAVMEKQLSENGGWFVGEGATAADIALYAYTHVADEAGFDLAPYPAIRGWLAAIAVLPGHVSLSWDGVSG